MRCCIPNQLTRLWGGRVGRRGEDISLPEQLFIVEVELSDDSRLRVTLLP